MGRGACTVRIDCVHICVEYFVLTITALRDGPTCANNHGPACFSQTTTAVTDLITLPVWLRARR